MNSNQGLQREGLAPSNNNSDTFALAYQQLSGPVLTDSQGRLLAGQDRNLGGLMTTLVAEVFDVETGRVVLTTASADNLDALNAKTRLILDLFFGDLALADIRVPGLPYSPRYGVGRAVRG